jgi:hypothetical protein
VDETDLTRAVQSLSDNFEEEKNKSVGTLTESPLSPAYNEDPELVGIAEGGVELARGIEPPTCGLQISERGLSKSLKTWAIPPSINHRATFALV